MDPLHSLHILFKLINFCAFIGLVVYLFYKKILKVAQENMKAEQTAKKELVFRIDLLDQESQGLERAIGEQQVYINQALGRLETWRIAAAQEYEKAQQEQKIFRVSAAHRQDQQQEHYQSAQEIKRVMPLIMKQAQEKLQQDYVRSRRIEDFDTAVTIFLRRHT